MSNKSLLQESEIRKMMKFANIGALSNTFVKKINEAGYYSEEEEDEDPMTGADDELAMDDEPAMDDELAMDDEPAMDMDPALDDEPEGAMAGGVTAEAALKGLSDFLEALGDPDVAAEVATKVQVDMTDSGDEAPMDDMPDMDAEPEMDDEPEMDVDVVDDEDEEGDQEEMFNEVVRRVAKRLMKK